MAYDEEVEYEVYEDNSTPSERRRIWDTARGLQEVDGLEVSEYANNAAEGYVNGNKTASALVAEVERYYADEGREAGEADLVATRITELLGLGTAFRFELSGRFLLALHAKLFQGLLEHKSWAGEWRKEVVGKREAVLGGRSVAYEHPDLIRASIEYDMAQERDFRYPPIFDKESVAHFADFVSGIWQIHPFREGNTRTSAVFAQLYLAQLGIVPGNDCFLNHGRWFRDTLVRAGYSSIKDGIEEDHSFIHAFFENVILDAGNDLKSMDMNLHGIRVVSRDYIDY